MSDDTNFERPPLIRTVVFDPIGTVRVAKRLANFVRLTRNHYNQIPDKAAQEELNRRATEWASKLLPAMGVEHLVEGESPEHGKLIVANHRSYIDILSLLAATPACFLAKDDVADWPVLGKAAVRVGTVFVKRDERKSRRAAREALRELLDIGHTVIVFPEGTTYRGPGCAEFRLGAFAAAHDVGVPVLPAALEYGRPEDAWQDEGLVDHFNGTFRQKQIEAHVHFGPLMEAATPEDLMDESHGWVNSRLHDIWEDKHG